MHAVQALTLGFLRLGCGGRRYHRPMGNEGDDAAPTGVAPTELGSAVEDTEAHAAWSLDDGEDWPTQRLTPARITWMVVSQVASSLSRSPARWRGWCCTTGLSPRRPAQRLLLRCGRRRTRAPWPLPQRSPRPRQACFITSGSSRSAGGGGHSAQILECHRAPRWPHGNPHARTADVGTRGGRGRRRGRRHRCGPRRPPTAPESKCQPLNSPNRYHCYQRTTRLENYAASQVVATWSRMCASVQRASSSGSRQSGGREPVVTGTVEGPVDATLR